MQKKTQNLAGSLAFLCNAHELESMKSSVPL